MEIWSILKILRSSHLQSQVIKRVMGRRCKYRRSFTCSLAAHLLLCGPVPNRLQTGILRFEDPYTNTCWGYRVCVCHAKLLQSCLTLCDPWAGVCQAPLSMGFSRQKYWSGLPFFSLGDLPHPGVEPASLISPALWVGSLPPAWPGKPEIIEAKY